MSGQLEIFEQKWDEQPHFSQVSGKPLGDEARAYFFSHLLPKSTYPELKLNIENIWFMTFEEHQKWDFGDTSDPIFDEAKKVRDQLKRLVQQNRIATKNFKL